MNVLSIVFNNFKNDRRVLKENISLLNAGYDVQVIALYEPPLKEREIIQNIPVHRLRLKTRNWGKSKFVQLLKYLEVFFILLRNYKNTDIIHCNDFDPLLISVIWKRLLSNKIKIVYDAHEYETERNDLYGFEKKIVKFLEKRLIKYVDKIITVSESIANEYVRLYGVNKPALVLNCPKFQKVVKKDLFREKFNLNKNDIIFLYIGGLQLGRGIEIILDVFKRLTNEKVLIVLGDGSLKEKVEVYAKTCKNIFYHPAVSYEILLNYTASADFGLLPYENTCLNHYFCLPNKLFDYLMAGLPVIVPDLLELKKIVETYRLGYIVESYKPENLITTINGIKKDDKFSFLNNIKKFDEEYNWENQEKALLKLYEEL